MTDIILEIDAVHAAYGRGANQVTALRGVTLSVTRGEIFGLLGPNGAGKSTLLACLEGLHTPAAGRVRVAGQAPAQAKGRLGVQLQKAALLDDLTVAELIEVYAALYNVFPSRAQIDQLLTRFSLLEQRGRLARQLSGGQQQRVALAVALASDPEIVLLDEPTSALDPQARRAVWDMVRRLHEEGRTVLLTTHAMEEAEALCGRVAIIDQGQIIACGTPAAIIAGLQVHSTLKALAELPLEQVRGLPGVRTVRYTGQHLEVETTEPQTTLPALQALAAGLGRTLGEISLRQPNLEDAFLHLTGRALSA
ncbi:MAG: ABC transporter ATP-binding protein [Anaerolineales bacterium]|nr:ABC transporter ATP-binding protein [Anaerolineales bacterium]